MINVSPGPPPTLDVNLLHLVDLGDGLPELLSEPPELLSAGGAEAHQLLLFGGEGTQHGDAVGIVYRRERERETERESLYYREYSIMG